MYPQPITTGHPHIRPTETKVELASVRRKVASRFVPPMPLSWFQRACRLPGKASIVATAAWYRSKLAGRGEFALSQAALTEFGVSRQARYRALEALEGAGLISVRRRPHRNPLVTVLVPEHQGD